MSNNSNQNIEDWLLKLPLYSPVALNGNHQDAACDLHLYTGTFDAFCPSCNKSSTFQAALTDNGKFHKKNHDEGFKITWVTDFIRKEASCTRQHHKLTYIFVINNDSLIKIGQLPSLADIAIEETSQFKAALTKPQLQELNKGIGLAAHGVGVGSYVYLRRVFESLIEEAHQLAVADNGWDEAEYQKSRMKEKIGLLKHHLPEFIVKNTLMYGVLSKGVHELTEEECLADFNKLKAAILVIAEEKLAEINRKKRVEQASKFFGS